MRCVWCRDLIAGWQPVQYDPDGRTFHPRCYQQWQSDVSHAQAEDAAQEAQG